MAKNFGSLGQASVDIVANLAPLSQGILKAKTIVAAGAAAIAAWAVATQRAVRAADAIGNSAAKVGLTAEAYQELKFATEIAAESAEGFDSAMEQFSKRLGEAKNGTGELLKTMIDLGVVQDAGELRGRGTVDLLEEYAEKVSNLSDANQQLKATTDAFGKSGFDMIAVLREGKSGIAGLRQEARDLGVVLSDQLVAQSMRANDELDKLGMMLKGNFQRVFLESAPLLERAAQTIGEGLVGAFKELQKHLPITTASTEELWRRLTDLTNEAARFMSQAENLSNSDIMQLADVDEGIFQINEELRERARLEDEAKREAIRRADAEAQAAAASKRADANEELLKKLTEIDQQTQFVRDHTTEAEQAGIQFSQQLINSYGGALQFTEQLADGTVVYRDVANDAFDQITRKTQEYEAAVAKASAELEKQQALHDQVRSAAEAGLGVIADGFERAIFEAGTFKESLADLGKELARLAFRMAMVGLIERAAGGIAGAFAPAPGAGTTLKPGSFAAAQHGASFTVGGGGGPDSLLMGLRVSPGEHVDISTPGQMRGGDEGVSVTIINHTGEPASTERRRRADGTQEIIAVIGRKIADDISNRGPVGQSIEARFGLNPKTALR